MMKSRPDPAPYTDADFEMWRSLARRQRFRVFGSIGLIGKIRASDHLDAALMWKAQQQRQWLETEHHGLLPPWFMPFEWECGPVGGDITRYIKGEAS